MRWHPQVVHEFFKRRSSLISEISLAALDIIVTKWQVASEVSQY